METIISARTAAVVTQVKYPISNKIVPVTIMALGLAGAEEVDIYISDDDGQNWTTLTDDAGSAVKLTATVPARVINGGGIYGFLKDLTVAAVAVKAYAL